MIRTAKTILAVGLTCAIAAIVLVAATRVREYDPNRAERAETLALAQSDRANSHDVTGHRERSQFPVNIRKPPGPPSIELVGVDPQGRSASVACSTCHQVRQPNFENVSAATLDEFHQGMEFAHGNITCYACHNPDDSDTLRLADDSSVPYEKVMQLCSQCHGLQATAYAHGAHGGMNGYWDLSRGPQMKNNCIDCHDPHSPKYPKMVVGFKPRDRFNESTAHDHVQKGDGSHDDH